MKYDITMTVDIDENRNAKLAIDSALSEYAIHVLNLNINKAERFNSFGGEVAIINEDY